MWLNVDRFQPAVSHIIRRPGLSDAEFNLWYVGERPLQTAHACTRRFFPKGKCVAITKCTVLLSEGHILMDVGETCFACTTHTVGA